jgi:thioredoxin 1
MAAINITVENFEEEVLNEKRPVLVDFWASWCGPCKMLSPIVEELAEELTNVKICKVNVDEQGALAEKFRVMTIPTLILFKEGKVVNTSVGVKPKADILDMLSIS